MLSSAEVSAQGDPMSSSKDRTPSVLLRLGSTGRPSFTCLEGSPSWEVLSYPRPATAMNEPNSQRPGACVDPSSSFSTSPGPSGHVSKFLGKPDKRGRICFWLDEMLRADQTCLCDGHCRDLAKIMEAQLLLPCLELPCACFTVKCTENQ